MSLRDWSSDVCSSDLEDYRALPVLKPAAHQRVQARWQRRYEIGRAPSRERVDISKVSKPLYQRYLNIYREQCTEQRMRKSAYARPTVQNHDDVRSGIR